MSLRDATTQFYENENVCLPLRTLRFCEQCLDLGRPCSGFPRLPVPFEPGFTPGARWASDFPAGKGGAAQHPAPRALCPRGEGGEAWLGGPQTSISQRAHSLTPDPPNSRLGVWCSVGNPQQLGTLRAAATLFCLGTCPLLWALPSRPPLTETLPLFPFLAHFSGSLGGSGRGLGNCLPPSQTESSPCFYFFGVLS